jgi:hypothetical protein
MYQASLQPPEPKAYLGKGIKKIHAAIFENNISDLLPVIEKYGRGRQITPRTITPQMRHPRSLWPGDNKATTPARVPVKTG